MRMDMFMDKLAQKLNAQEIIKANTAADTEELNGHVKVCNAVYAVNKVDEMRATIERLKGNA